MRRAAAAGKGWWWQARAAYHARMDDRTHIVERTEIEDRIRALEKDLRGHTWGLALMLAAAAVFFVLGVVHGTPGYVAGAFLGMASLVPMTRRMMKADEIRRANNELRRLPAPGEESGPSGDVPYLR